MAISLAKALKLKNRQVAKIQKLQGIVTTHNSRLVGGSEEFDVAASLAELRNATEALVKLKAAISLANAPIQETIYRIGELKSHISFLRRIPTTSGSSCNRTECRNRRSTSRPLPPAKSRKKFHGLKRRSTNFKIVWTITTPPFPLSFPSEKPLE